MDQAKLNFVRNDFIFHLKHLAPDAKGRWGKMNGQQMVEHFVEVLQLANGRWEGPVLFDEARIRKAYEWLMSDKPFRENTISPLLPETPKPLRHGTIQQAIEALQQELNYFFERYEGTPGLRIYNPIFGDLNFEEQVQLLYKHTQHHLRQFGLVN
ncbi:MAG: hypothetical protein P0Y53_06340 [Candidatus Pseudobacter hemicellulosilyticus]|uniref:DinB-like domain-containing protein n=1 Tax=Candidatus Pseudobacter hemicellulosilyticus TaxID=3121375 RepID=A0AAJ6BIQ7_9BACT|nr:MAG: hypothetical protein P0Y53_06340 [Pseudobacter sp.]